ncbi:Adenylate-forming Reductase [Pleurotus pulmonarius]
MIACPPTDGSLLFSQTVDFHSKLNPTRPMYKFVEDGSERVATVTFMEFARACHRVAHHVHPADSPGVVGQVVAILATCDTILYHALFIGVHKAGMVPFPISPRNSPLAIVGLLKATDCHRVIATKLSLKNLLTGIEVELDKGVPFSVNIEEAPSLADVYPHLGRERPDDMFSPYGERYTTPDLSSVALYLHSSGSTGFPKAIPFTQLTILQWAALSCVTELKDHPHQLALGTMALPSFHTLGVYMQLLVPIFAGVPACVYTPTMTSAFDMPVMPTPDNILEHARRVQCNILITLPTLLQIWSHSPSSVEYLKSLFLVAYSGGSPPQDVGKALSAAGVVCRSVYGLTELGAPVHWVWNDADDWEYIRFSTNGNFRWVDQGAGRYELHVLPSNISHINVHNLPNNSGYATSDLFEKHSTKVDLWKMVGRLDDVIVHATGEKTVPTPMESIIASHPLIQGVVMFGERQTQPGVLIELRDDSRYPSTDAELESIRNYLWSTIEEANDIAPAFSRIFKDTMLFVSPNRPLPRTGKGTVMRKAATKLYADDIQRLYDTIEAGVGSSNVKGPEEWTQECLTSWLVAQTLDLMPNTTFSVEADLFEQGFNSLSATLLRRRIAASLRSTQTTSPQSVDVSQTLVYDYPSIEKLANALALPAFGHVLSVDDRASRIESMIQFNISQLEPMNTSGQSTSRDASDTTVLLTGSTGALGSHLLFRLLKDDSVQKVFTLNRTASAPVHKRQLASFRDQGLDMSILASPKLVSLEGDLTKPQFAMDQDAYNEIRDSVTIIIHNAWRLDFNLTLPSFEPLVIGSRNLLNMARTGPRASTICFLFASSVSSVQSWKEERLVPDEVFRDARVAIGTGYGESKYVVERILAASGIHACSLRIGQICGGEPNGAWSFTDWVPILVKSSIGLKALPDTTGTVSWIQIDSVAQVILDIASSPFNHLPSVVNIAHPRPVPWTSVLTAIQQSLLDNTRGAIVLPLIPLQEWFELLRTHAVGADEETASQIPAVKLLSFFHQIANAPDDLPGIRESGGLPALSVEKAQKISPSLRKAKDVVGLTVQKWAGYWINGGLLV